MKMFMTVSALFWAMAVNAQAAPLALQGSQTVSSGTDTQKEKLAEQFFSVMPSTEDSVKAGIVQMVTRDKTDSFLKFLKNHGDLDKLDKSRKEFLMKDFSSEQIKAAVDFHLSPAGKSYTAIKDQRLKQLDAEFDKVLSEELEKWRNSKGKHDDHAANTEQATTITLKNGRTVSGQIIGEDNSKLTVREGAINLTYYKDEIASMQGLADNTDTPKERLIHQYISLMWSIEYHVERSLIKMLARDKRHSFLAFLTKDGTMKRLEKVRMEWVIRNFSSDQLKAVVDYHLSPAGIGYFEHKSQYARQVDAVYRHVFNKEMIRWKNEVRP